MRSRRYYKKIKDSARKGALERWRRENERIEAEKERRLFEMEKSRVLGESVRADGSYIGTLEWRDHSGKVRRWVIRRGPRYNQMRIDGVRGPKSATVLMAKLRESISCYFRGASIGG